MANLIPVCIDGALTIVPVENTIKCAGALSTQVTSVALESPITIEEHIELAWLVVMVLIAAVIVHAIKGTMS